MPTTHDAVDLPSSEEIELAEYKVGSFISDLDHFRMRVEELSEGMTPEEYLRLRDAGEEIPKPAALDQPLLARIVVFADDAIHDAETISRDARRLKSEARALFHENGRAVDDAYLDRMAAWHQQALAAYEDRKTGDD